MSRCGILLVSGCGSLPLGAERAGQPTRSLTPKGV